MDSATMALPRGRAAQGALKRVASAVVLIPIFVWMVSRGPAWLFVLFVVAVGAAAVWELSRMWEQAARPAYTRLGVVSAIAVMGSFAVPASYGLPVLPMLALSLVLGTLLSAPLWTGGRLAIEPMALTVLGVVYVAWFLGHAVLVYRLPDGADLVLLLVGVTWIGESTAYLVGSALGRHKLAPVVSPNKTIEGGVAQVIASVLGALALGAWLTEWSTARAVGAGVLLGLVGQIGDLAESIIKRSVGVKDTGNLIPGHGGILDRVDGLLFNAPALYYYAVLGSSS
jgi:phosphatidate cytidylyltransferase